ncbi:MAG: MBL fold metallo-hydrolase, partial [Verrucomicrobiota bacterium]|nr:MBL fold metallo-hydrolase [Verrucomicrobiota bacterium]
MNIHVLPAGPIQTNAYLLTEPSRGEAVLIDAPGGVWSEVQPILRAEKCRLIEFWITHGHWDHTQGAAEVVRATGARVRAHADDKMLFETPEVMTRFSGEDLELEPIKIDAWVR